MIKIGKIETINSLIYRLFEVIETNGKMYAGDDAYSWPDVKSDLKAFEWFSLPGEWRWVERLAIRDLPLAVPRPKEGKYVNVEGIEAEERLMDILSRHETGLLCLQDEGQPYAIPINHAFRNGKLFMHCGKKGRKVQIIQKNSAACYNICGPSEDEPKQLRSCHLPYESIIFYGKVRISEDKEEIEEAIREITEQYGTPYQHGFADMIYIIVFDVDYATIREGRFTSRQERILYHYRPSTERSG